MNASKARRVLEKAVRCIHKAKTLRFEGRKLHTAAAAYGLEVMKDVVTRVRYHSWSRAGTTFIRVESSATMLGTTITTVFIKDIEGVWEVLPNHVCEVSSIYTQDQLLGTFPFVRLSLALHYPYELCLQDRVQNGTERFLVSGTLRNKPDQGAPDVASRFTYEIDKRDGLPRSLDETTFGGKWVELRLDEWGINGPMDQGLFELPEKEKVVMTSLNQYWNLRTQEWAKTMPGPE